MSCRRLLSLPQAMAGALAPWPSARRKPTPPASLLLPQLYAEAVPKFQDWLLAAMDAELRDALLALQASTRCRLRMRQRHAAARNTGCTRATLPPLRRPRNGP